MRSGGSPLLLLWALLAVWMLPVSGLFHGNCDTIPDEHRRCGQLEERFFHNVSSGKCEPFIYYGCTKNLNRFYSQDDCEQFCGLVDYCQLPPDQGFCLYEKRRWFYDVKTKKCKTFTYKGCGGNYNNFRRRSHCKKKCPKRDSGGGAEAPAKREKRTVGSFRNLFPKPCGKKDSHSHH